MFDTLAEEVGVALRRAREARDLSLRDAASASPGAFKPSTLASYERAERKVTIERFFQLAFLYDISPVRLILVAQSGSRRGLAPYFCCQS